MATITRLSSKGQVLIPKEIRDTHGWKEGDEFVVEDQPDGVKLRPVARFPRVALSELVGCVGYRGPRKSLAEMDRGIEQAVAGVDDRG